MKEVFSVRLDSAIVDALHKAPAGTAQRVLTRAVAPSWKEHPDAPDIERMAAQVKTMALLIQRSVADHPQISDPLFLEAVILAVEDHFARQAHGQKMLGRG